MADLHSKILDARTPAPGPIIFFIFMQFSGGKMPNKWLVLSLGFTSSLGNNGSAIHPDILFEKQCSNNITHNTCDGSYLVMDT